MPLGSYFRVHERVGDEARVTRVSCSSSPTQCKDLIKYDGLRAVFAQAVPPHVLLAQKSQSMEVVIEFGSECTGESYSGDIQYFDAGPKSTSVESGMKFKIRTINSEYTEATLLDAEGQSSTMHTSQVEW